MKPKKRGSRSHTLVRSPFFEMSGRTCPGMVNSKDGSVSTRMRVMLLSYFRRSIFGPRRSGCVPQTSPTGPPQVRPGSVPEGDMCLLQRRRSRLSDGKRRCTIFVERTNLQAVPSDAPRTRWSRGAARQHAQHATRAPPHLPRVRRRLLLDGNALQPPQYTSNCRGQKNNPNCLCGIIPPPGTHRLHGLWTKVSSPASLHSVFRECASRQVKQSLFAAAIAPLSLIRRGKDL